MFDNFAISEWGDIEMKVKDLIAEKDYEYITYRMRIDSDDIFVGECKSVDGKLISLDGDTIYDEDDEVIRYEETENGLIVVVKYEEDTEHSEES